MDSVLSNEVARRIAADLATLVSEAEKHGTLPRIKSVAFYFNETELRTIIKLMRSRHGILDPAQPTPRQIVEECARQVELHAASMREEKTTLTASGVSAIADGLLSRFDHDGFGLAAQPPAAPASPARTAKGVCLNCGTDESFGCDCNEDAGVRPPSAPVEMVREQAYSSIETCYDCGVDEPCGEDCPNYQEQEPPANDRETRTGAHLLQMAKSLGWPDDGEGALEFMLRRAREVAFEDCGHQRSSAAAPVETDALGVIESDRLFAEQIQADFGAFEEGITDKEKLAQWIRNVRRASSTPDAPPLQSSSAGNAAEAVAYVPWHPERGYCFSFSADTEQAASARLMMAVECAAGRGWEIRPVYAAEPQELPETDAALRQLLDLPRDIDDRVIHGEIKDGETVYLKANGAEFRRLKALVASQLTRPHQP